MLRRASLGVVVASIVACASCGGRSSLDAGTFCPAPSTMGRWKAPTTHFFTPAQAVWGGHEAAVAYVEALGTQQNGARNYAIELQRLTVKGATVGAPVVLEATVERDSVDFPHVSIATDGARYLACWSLIVDGAYQTTCAAVPVGGGAATRGLVVSGSSPSIAFRPSGWALVYESDMRVLAQRLSDDASALGDPVEVSASQKTMPAPLVTATPSGFAVVDTPDPSDTGNVLRRLDPELHAVTSPVVVGTKWSYGRAIAALGETVAVVMSSPAGNTVAIVDSEGDVSTRTTNGDESYFVMDIAAGDRSFALFSTLSGELVYSAIDVANQPIGAMLEILPKSDWGQSPSIATTATSDGFLVVAAVGKMRDEMVVMHLTCR